jgi:phenylpropionate dioxygenase-like ring-hydroxylating dioxygenase large terminal subunit
MTTELITQLDALSSGELARVTTSEAEAWSLPPVSYTSEAIYADEIQRIFRTHWLSVGRTQQLAQPGDYFTVDICGYPLVIVRDRTGAINCFSRICRHRAAEIVRGSGNVKLFFCPYHEWSYQLDGQFRGAPFLDQIADLDREACALPRLKTDVWNGFIFVNFDLDAPPLGAQIPRFTKAWENWHLEDLVMVDEYLEFESNYNWKILVENFMEAYHHMGTHKDLLQGVWPGEMSIVPDNEGEPGALVNMPATDGVSEGEGCTFPVIETLEGWERTGIIAGVMFPYNLFVAFPDGAAWYQIFPESVNQFTLRIHGLFPQSTVELETFASDLRKWAEFMRYLHLQDHGVNQEVWKGLTSPVAAQGRLHPLERAVWQGNQWWTKSMGLS